MAANAPPIGAIRLGEWGGGGTGNGCKAISSTGVAGSGGSERMISMMRIGLTATGHGSGSDFFSVAGV